LRDFLIFFEILVARALALHVYRHGRTGRIFRRQSQLCQKLWKYM